MWLQFPLRINNDPKAVRNVGYDFLDLKIVPSTRMKI
jgi:hypothetical protein